MTTYEMYDSTDPDMIPDGAFALLYGSGPFDAHDYPRLDRFAHVLWIDVTAEAWQECSILDVETFDATPADVPAWVKRRIDSRDGPARIYCNISTWPAVRSEVLHGLDWAYRRQIRYWIANPTGVAHLVPGSAACQYEWAGGFDRTLALERFI